MATIPGDVITTLIMDYDGVDSTDALDERRRSMVLGYLQHINSYVHNFREWRWTYSFESPGVTLIAGNGIAEMPADFMEWGRHGGMWRSSDQTPYRELHMAHLMKTKVQNTQNQHIPVFSVIGAFVNFAYTLDAAASNQAFDTFYRLTPQVLEDDPGNVNTAFELPDQYIHTVILPGTRFLMQQSKADVKDGEYGGQFKDGLQQMLVIENRKKTAADLMPLSRRNW